MQGWRKSMEDDHVFEPNVSENISVFAVFDGHGVNGHFASSYLKNKFPGILKRKFKEKSLTLYIIIK